MNNKNLTFSISAPKDEGTDHVYYNVNIVNNSFQDQSADFDQILPSDIVGNAKDYYLFISRFSIDASQIPIFIFPKSTDVPYRPFYVVLTYNGFTSGGSIVLPPPDARISNNGDIGIYSYGSIVTAINLAYQVAYTNLNTASGGTLPIGSVAPYLTYDSVNGLFSCWADGRYYADSLSTPISMYMNWTLFDLFIEFNHEYFGKGLVTHRDIRIKFIDLYGTNTIALNPTSIPANYYRMTQENPSLTRWFECQTIVFQTRQIPTRNEYVTGVNTSTSLTPQTNLGSIPNSKILTDFQPSFDSANKAGFRTGALIYVPPYPRLEDLSGGNEVRNIDIQISWKSQNGTLHPFLIPPGKSVTVKICLVRKSLYKSIPLNVESK